jgi:(p)ppGpp synthase/HD superfamily hydrolase
MTILDKAKLYASKCHRETNHLYAGEPYETHLEAVDNVAFRFSHLLPLEDIITVRAACWCHDLIEDARQTYSDVKYATSERVADIVYAVTNEKGKTRKERANDKYYAGIRAVQYADFVKICDRIANVEHAVATGHGMLKKYREEHALFVKELYSARSYEMLYYLAEITFNEL